MNDTAASEKIRSFLATYFDPSTITDSDDFVAQGLVSSLLLLELIGFVRRRFAISIQIQEIDLKDFRSVDAIVSFVRRKQASVQ